LSAAFPAGHPAQVRAIPNNPMSRRSLLRAFGAGAAGVTLAGCGVPAAYVQAGDRAGHDYSGSDHGS
jgi:spermidine/putrescine transport system substrate-binding protein